MSDKGFEALAEAHGLDYVQGRHGWLNMACPFCGDNGKHLGYCLKSNVFTCWRCGKHGVKETLMTLLNCSEGQARHQIAVYGLHQRPEIVQERQRQTTFSLPPDFRPLRGIHKRYIRSRGFNPDLLETVWNVMGTTNTGTYKYRLGIPIYYRGKPVSFTTRDITDRSKMRYMSCPADKEAIHHKDILYGLDEVPGNSVVVVEGVTKVWRLGKGSVATFGIKWTKGQVDLIRQYKRRFVLFDNEPLANRQARRLTEALAVFSGYTELLQLTDEPFDDVADASNGWARRLMKELKIY